MSGQPAAIIDINLLPAEHRPREVTPLQAAALALTAAAIIGLVPLSAMANTARDEVTLAERRADDTARRMEAVRVELTAARGIRFDIEETQRLVDELIERQTALQRGARPLSHDLPALWGSDYVPPGSRITRVQESTVGFTVLGTAPGPLDAIAYAKTLVERAGFSGASMTSFAPGANGGEFTVEVQR